MTTSFNPTHQLVSRSRRVPVVVVPAGEYSQIFTEQEWLEDRQPAFELHSKLGMFCRGMKIVGYHLEPLAQAVEAQTKNSTAA